MEKERRTPTCDGDRGVALLAQQRVDQPAAVGAIGLQHHCQHAGHAEQPFLIGHQWGGDIVRQVASAAILPYHVSLRITTVGHASQGHRVTRPQIGFRLQSHYRFGVGGWKQAQEEEKGGGGDEDSGRVGGERGGMGVGEGGRG